MTTALVVAIAIVSGINVFNSQKPEVLSDVAMENVEALADAVAAGTCDSFCYKCDGWMCGKISNGETTRCLNYRLKE